jgi:hypothetical protein
MKSIKINLKNVILYVLIIIVTFLVILALYFNWNKFNCGVTIKYGRINIDKETNIDEIADRYTDCRNKAKFISEIKRINDIKSTEFIPGNSSLIIPIIKSE